MTPLGERTRMLLGDLAAIATGVALVAVVAAVHRWRQMFGGDR